MRNEHTTVVGLKKAHNVAECDRLADAAAADDRERVARIDVKADVDQDRMIEALTDVAELNVTRVFVGVNFLCSQRSCPFRRCVAALHRHGGLKADSVE